MSWFGRAQLEHPKRGFLVFGESLDQTDLGNLSARLTSLVGLSPAQLLKAATLADGTRHLLFELLEFLKKFAALIPRSRVNLVLYHGVLAAHARWPPRVVAPEDMTALDTLRPLGLSDDMRPASRMCPRPRSAPNFVLDSAFIRGVPGTQMEVAHAGSLPAEMPVVGLFAVPDTGYARTIATRSSVLTTGEHGSEKALYVSDALAWGTLARTERLKPLAPSTYKLKSRSEAIFRRRGHST